MAATHGRGFWMLDDLTPLRENARDDGTVTLYTPPQVHRYPTPNGFEIPGEGTWVGGFPGVPLGGASFIREPGPDGSDRTVVIDGGENPPDGLVIWYHLGATVAAVEVEISDERRVLRTISGTRRPGRPEPVIPGPGTTLGLHRVVWDLRIEGAVSAPDGDGKVRPVFAGPRVPPDSYTVTVRAGNESRSASVSVLGDPRIFSSHDDLREQYDLLGEIRDGLDLIGRTVDWIRTQPATNELPDLEHLLVGGPTEHSDALKDPPSLLAKIVLLPEIVVELSDTAPTAAVRVAWLDLQRQLDVVLVELHEHGLPKAGRQR